MPIYCKSCGERVQLFALARHAEYAHSLRPGADDYFAALIGTFEERHDEADRLRDQLDGCIGALASLGYPSSAEWLRGWVGIEPDRQSSDGLLAEVIGLRSRLEALEQADDRRRMYEQEQREIEESR